MTRPKQEPLPARSHDLLLVEGGDETKLCRAVAGPVAWATFHCMNAYGRDGLPVLAAAASRDANFDLARSIRIVLDVEESLPAAIEIAQRTLTALGTAGPPVHGLVTAGRGVFFLPDSRTP